MGKVRILLSVRDEVDGPVLGEVEAREGMQLLISPVTKTGILKASIEFLGDYSLVVACEHEDGSLSQISRSPPPELMAKAEKGEEVSWVAASVSRNSLRGEG